MTLIAGGVAVGITIATGGLGAVGVAATGVGANAALIGGTTAGSIAGAGTGAALAAGTGATAGGVAIAGATGATSISSAMASAGLAGSAAGPLGAFFFCFDQSTKFQLSSGQFITAKDLKIDDEVVSNDIKRNIPSVAKVSVFKIVHGKFQGKKITLGNGISLKVTNEHMMIYNKIPATSNLMIKPAREIVVGDYLFGDDNNAQQVIQIEDIEIVDKVNVETSDGIIMANGVITSGFCENNGSSSLYAIDVVEDYVKTHFPIIKDEQKNMNNVAAGGVLQSIMAF